MQNRLAIFLVVFVCLTAISSSVTFYILSPKPAQPFMGFGVFSAQGLQGYVRGNMTISPPQTLNWNLTVTNRTGNEEFTMIIVRIGDSATSSPNETEPASSLPELGNIERFIGSGETSNLNFTWTVESTNETGGLVYLNLQIDGKNINTAYTSPPFGATPGSNFRLIFELWTFDIASNSFQYGYHGQDSQTGTWLQVWFRVT